MSQEGVYCGKRLKQILGVNPSVRAIPISVLEIVAVYAADERFVRPLYLGQDVIARDQFLRWYDAKVLEIRPESLLLTYPPLAHWHNEVVGVKEIDERIAADGPGYSRPCQISTAVSECLVDWMRTELSSVVVDENMPLITISRFLNENISTVKEKMAVVTTRCGIKPAEIVDIARFSRHIMMRVSQDGSHMWFPLFPLPNLANILITSLTF